MNDNARAVFEGLNPEQAGAVNQVAGPVLIVAGAGSGKTRVLTCRIANILSQGVPASRVLALTFTKKAATQMQARVAAMVGTRVARGVVMGTFHSVFVRFLRDYADFLGYPKEFTIYDTSDSTSMIKSCLKELNLDDKTYKPKSVLGRISEAKNNLASPAAYMTNQNAIERDRNAKMPRLVEVYDLYWKKCRKAGVMDFDDILFNMNLLMRDNPVALDEIARRFDYILVDEYQDTNRAQYLILKKLAATHRNICVVGDDSQSIYAFRGARIENILNFRKDYPECKTFRLEQNYRSTRVIVDAANSLIEHNAGRIPKTCFSQGEKGEQIRLIKAYNEQEEASLIVSSITGILLHEGAQYRDFALLYRTNAQSRALEEALRRRNIPYMIYSGNSFFERAEIKDLMAYFKLCCNPSDDESFKRAVGKPSRGIGDTTISALSAASYQKSLPLMDTVYASDLEQFSLKGAAITRLRNFCDMIRSFSSRMDRTDAYDMAIAIARESGLWEFFRSDLSIEGQARFANVEELCNSVKSYVEQRQNDAYEDALAYSQDVVQKDILVTLPDYLENVALLSAVDVEDEDSDNKVALMTVHSSKGLEFPHVYVAGMEENLFPSNSGAMARPSDIEEERRLFYVAITRAMKSLCISFAANRMRNGKSESNPVSRFVREIDDAYIANPLADDMKRVRSESFQSSVRTVRTERAERTMYTERRITPVKELPNVPLDSTPIMDLRVGQRIEHMRFGQGTILSLVDDPESGLKATIDFDLYSKKVLLMKFAKVRVVG